MTSGLVCLAQGKKKDKSEATLVPDLKKFLVWHKNQAWTHSPTTPHARDEGPEKGSKWNPRSLGGVRGDFLEEVAFGLGGIE